MREEKHVINKEDKNMIILMTEYAGDRIKPRQVNTQEFYEITHSGVEPFTGLSIYTQTARYQVTEIQGA